MQRMLSRGVPVLALAAPLLVLACSNVADVRTAAQRGDEEDKVLICHLTSRKTDPYVKISISRAALAQHIEQHGDPNPDFPPNDLGDCVPSGDCVPRDNMTSCLDANGEALGCCEGVGCNPETGLCN